jgi:hypothetical protein
VGVENGIGTKIAIITIAIHNQNCDAHPFIKIILFKVSETSLVNLFYSEVFYNFFFNILF